MRPLVLLLLAVAAIVMAPAAFAGGGPETTLVVVNDDSPLSKQIANAYVRMRGIHPTHVCRLRDIPNLTVIPIETFRGRILAPIRSYIRENDLEDEIDVIAYSADFPFGVNYDGDFKGETLPQGVHKHRVASLTGATYLHHLISAKDRRWLDLRGDANRYARIVPTSGEVHSAHGYRRFYKWNGEIHPGIGEDAEGDGGYYLSTMLAATGIQGNTIDEVLAYLYAARDADGTHPDGTVYLMDHEDIRARTRKQFFGPTQKLLQAMDRPSEVLVQGQDDQDGKVPVCREDILGLVAGIAGFNFETCQSRLLPGSIAEHLTSFGAKLDGSGQTKCTVFLRHGAAGTSGAVAEPYALWMKFPLPFLHGHYAQGASLAEAFYQNVLSPYQLLVIGDPLARPFAHLQDIELEGIDPKKPLEGTVTFTVKTDSKVERPIGAVELWIDGKFVSKGPPETPLEIDTTTLDDGDHTLRVVAVEGSEIETRSSIVERVRVKNGEQTVTLTAPKKAVPLNDEIKLKGKAKGASEVEVFVGAFSLGTAKVKRNAWKLDVPAGTLGIGTSEIQARGTFGDRTVRSPIRDVEVGLPDPIEPAKKKRRPKKDDDEKKGAKGLKATVVDKNKKTHELAVTFIGRMRKEHFAKQVGAKAPGTPRSVILEGEIHIPTEGLQRLAINASGSLKIEILGQTVFEKDDLALDKQAYAAFTVEPGWHPIKIEYQPRSGSDLWVMLGGADVSAFLSQENLRH